MSLKTNRPGGSVLTDYQNGVLDVISKQGYNLARFNSVNPEIDFISIVENIGVLVRLTAPSRKQEDILELSTIVCGDILRACLTDYGAMKRYKDDILLLIDRTPISEKELSSRNTVKMVRDSLQAVPVPSALAKRIPRLLVKLLDGQQSPSMVIKIVITVLNLTRAIVYTDSADIKSAASHVSITSKPLQNKGLPTLEAYIQNHSNKMLENISSNTNSHSDTGQMDEVSDNNRYARFNLTRITIRLILYDLLYRIPSMKETSLSPS